MRGCYCVEQSFFLLIGSSFLVVSTMSKIKLISSPSIYTCFSVHYCQLAKINRTSAQNFPETLQSGFFCASRNWARGTLSSDGSGIYVNFLLVMPICSRKSTFRSLHEAFILGLPFIMLELIKVGRFRVIKFERNAQVLNIFVHFRTVEHLCTLSTQKIK